MVLPRVREHSMRAAMVGCRSMTGRASAYVWAGLGAIGVLALALRPGAVPPPRTPDARAERPRPPRRWPAGRTTRHDGRDAAALLKGVKEPDLRGSTLEAVSELGADA